MSSVIILGAAPMDKVFLVHMQQLLDGSNGSGWRRLGGIILVGLLAVYLA